MSTFSTYNTIIEQKIANNSELFFTSEMKRQAANDTTKEILQQYDLPEMMIRATLSFTTGNAAKPADLFRIIKLWDVDANGIETNVYEYRPPEEFDDISLSDSYWWTEDYVIANAARRYLIRPNDTATLQIRYVQTPTDMTDDSTDNGLTDQWDECIAYGAVVKLLQNDGRYNEAQEFERIYKAKIRSVYMSVKSPGGFKRGTRLKSRYERINIHNRF